MKSRLEISSVPVSFVRLSIKILSHINFAITLGLPMSQLEAQYIQDDPKNYSDTLETRWDL